MRTLFLVLASSVLLLSGCREIDRSTEVPVELASPSADEALAALQGPEGPPRFGVVTPRLYRGGQPTAQHLRDLHALGVTKVIDLRRERMGVRRAEQAAARELGMELVELPFYGVFGAEPAFLDDVIEHMRADDGGAVYIHCDDGRDRTSLLVALYRVVVDGWAPEDAWAYEVLAYGHEPTPIHREIRLAFEEHTLEHELRTQTARVAPQRTRAVAALIDDPTRALVRAPVEAGPALASTGSPGGGLTHAGP